MKITIILLTLALIISIAWQNQRYNFLIVNYIAEKNLSKERLKINRALKEQINECLGINDKINDAIGG